MADEDRSSGLHVALAGAHIAARYKRELSLDNLPSAVLEALRHVKKTQDQHLQSLSAEDRQLFAAAMHWIARYDDLMAQIDGNGNSGH